MISDFLSFFFLINIPWFDIEGGSTGCGVGAAEPESDPAVLGGLLDCDWPILKASPEFTEAFDPKKLAGEGSTGFETIGWGATGSGTGVGSCAIGVAWIGVGWIGVGWTGATGGVTSLGAWTGTTWTGSTTAVSTAAIADALEGAKEATDSAQSFSEFLAVTKYD